MSAPLGGRLAKVVEAQASIARAGLDAAAVLRLVAVQAKDLTGAESAAVVVVNGGGTAVRAAAGAGTAGHPAFGAIARSAVESGAATSWPNLPAPLGATPGVASAAAVPLGGADAPNAALVVGAPEPAAFEPEDLEVLRQLASLAEAALTAGEGLASPQRVEAERFAHASTHDVVTQLPNRALFGDRLRHALALARRRRTRLCVMVVDLLGFGELNDEVGSGAGDEVLRAVAERLRSAVREPDTVARLGADEFVLLLGGDVTVEAARVLEDRIRAALEAPVATAAGSLTVRAPVGVAFYPDDGDDPEMLIERAESALLS